MDVVLVNENDKIIGYKEKFEAHHNPVPLHRAISVVIISSDGKKMLLQKRPHDKPTWGGFWSNTCCTHPMKGESYKHTAVRRLFEEMGIKTQLVEKFKFIYKAKCNTTWGEHELDATFVGYYDGEVNANPEEAEDWKWLDIKDLKKDIKENPDIYTPWFKILLPRIQLE